jgi:hypothetical protein
LQLASYTDEKWEKLIELGAVLPTNNHNTSTPTDRASELADLKADMAEIQQIFASNMPEIAS